MFYSSKIAEDCDFAMSGDFEVAVVCCVFVVGIVFALICCVFVVDIDAFCPSSFIESYEVELGRV